MHAESQPKMGRPNASGLSVKLLGPSEYARRWHQANDKRKTSRRWWTGVRDVKVIGHAAYMRLYRAAKRAASGGEPLWANQPTKTRQIKPQESNGAFKTKD